MRPRIRPSRMPVMRSTLPLNRRRDVGGPSFIGTLSFPKLWTPPNAKVKRVGDSVRAAAKEASASQADAKVVQAAIENVLPMPGTAHPHPHDGNRGTAAPAPADGDVLGQPVGGSARQIAAVGNPRRQGAAPRAVVGKAAASHHVLGVGGRRSPQLPTELKGVDPASLARPIDKAENRGAELMVGSRSWRLGNQAAARPRAGVVTSRDR